ncbi:hypothetical protein BDR07DRAFT_698617 [Suillus spraguei]|nr:hypothetical protein BDR07DRAFT_698617 [Suillus spraguei]
MWDGIFSFLFTAEDLQYLVELHAFMHESLRWRPVVPLGFPHRATGDIIWKGIRIPNGATVYGSLIRPRAPTYRRLLHITGLYLMTPDPEKFDPQR